MVRFYVWFSTGKYDPMCLSDFDTEKQVIAFLNEHAANDEFSFTVVHGSEVRFKPVTTAVSYKRADT